MNVIADALSRGFANPFKTTNMKYDKKLNTKSMLQLAADLCDKVVINDKYALNFADDDLYCVV